MITLTPNDFELVGMVAKHCNVSKLNIAINEAITFDAKPLLCGLFYDVSENWEQEEGVWHDLIKGSTYEDCNEKEVKHAGFEKIITYYAYARYLIINKTDDTAAGMVQKTNQFSMPTPLKEVYSISNRYRNMAKQLWSEVEAFICKHKDDYPNGDFSNCKTCGCNGSCGSIVTKGFGISGRNVSKYDL